MTLGTYVDVTDPQFAGGAKGDRSTNNGPALDAAYAYAASAGGTVFWPPGWYLTDRPVRQAKYVKSLGCGRGATTVERTTNQPLFTTYGAGTGDRSWYCGMESMTLRGGDYAATLLDLVYASQFVGRELHFFGCTGRAIDIVEGWDSNFTDVFFEWCGAAGVPAVHVRNSRSASGFGNSLDNSNEIRFTNAHFEMFPGGAIRVEAFQGSNEPNGVYVTNLKMENHVTSGSDPFVYIAPEANRVNIKNVYAFTTDGGLVDVIDTRSRKFVTVRDVFIGNPAGLATIRTGVNIDTGDTSGGMTIVDGVYGSYGTAPTVAHVNRNNNPSASIVTTNLASNRGLLLAGADR